MEAKIAFHVPSITRREYLQAGTESVRRMALPCLGIAAGLTVIIALAIDDFSLRSVVPPFALVLVFLAAMWLLVVFSWKNYPADTAFSYRMDETGWELTVGDTRVFVAWEDTVRLTLRQDVVLLFNEDGRSNLVPRRFLSPEELSLVKSWFRGSRREARLRGLERDRKFMERRRNNRVEASSRLDSRKRRKR